MWILQVRLELKEELEKEGVMQRDWEHKRLGIVVGLLNFIKFLVHGKLTNIG
jgi:hypothetical protein